MRKWKIGDRVRLNPKKVTQSRLDIASCTGRFGKVYVIQRTGGTIYGQDAMYLDEANWHLPEWFMPDIQIYLGGE
jgi:hypothetical protein